MIFKGLAIPAIVAILFSPALAQELPKTSCRFDFGSADTKIGYIPITAETFYSKDKGYGFLPGASIQSVDRGGDVLKGDFITSDQPFYFTVDLPEGDYDVKVILGDKKGTSEQTVRAECRRMMVYKEVTKSGQQIEKNFTVHIRTPQIAGTGQSVKLKPRELAYFHWDNQLTLEFNGMNPKVAAVEIKRADKPIRLFLAGNSTVVDQASEPFAAWGQMMPAFFEPGKISVANYAESGETLSNFKGARRLEKILSQMRKGDYLFIEFGHNDQKQKGEGIGAFTSYKRDLKYYIAEARKKGGIPVIVTSIQRRNFNENGTINETLGDYPEACRQTAREENVPLIDLNKMTKVLYEAWGPKESETAFAHNPQIDNTHPNPFGAYQMAKCVIKGIQESKLDIARYIVNFDGFDPAKPERISAFYWPLSPSKSTIKPDGN
ncbi:rhamnogalacturonan acetylesterase [Pedobacter sp. SYSU D00535]|uniref:rhamnogalacturonan acetylesterase n=1 Tax=Pedobacter sp. SYSU D00535 TaxID=2810308 RepID=UPI001A95E08C|nr:GDSL-type esterase/lipase family protein [Pedobacter sp. SYSU D00535]